MEKFDKDLISVNCVTHNFENLPMKGLGRSMEGVGLYEPVIICESITLLNGLVWGYTEAEIERRAAELQAAINWMELPSDSCADARKFQMWFSKIDNHNGSTREENH